MDKINDCCLDDMEKYNKNFKREHYEELEELAVKSMFRDYYYDKNLPVDLLSWCRVNQPSDEMIYKKVYWTQIMFIRDTINNIFYKSYKEYENNPVMVINTHTSKSIKLPVYEINIKKHNLKMILRHNFYDWKVSVISNKDISIDFMNLFNENDVINSVYCEGFKKEQVFDSFKNNKKEFTFEIDDNFKLFTFMYILNNYLNKTEINK